MKVKLLAAAAAACLVAAPSLAFSQSTSAGKVSAADTPAWVPANITITAGQSVTFESTGNAMKHYLAFRDAKPACDSGVATSYPPPANWSGSCTFNTPGDYSFYCPLHDIPPYSTMRGTIHVVAAPVDTPTPGTTVTPGASPTPTPEPTPAGPKDPTAETQTQPTKLTYKLASSQKGTRVRGSITAEQAGSRLEITITHSGHRVGHWTKIAAKTGAQAFNVKIAAKARKLTLRVTVALTPPGGKKLSHAVTVKLRR